MKLIKGDNVSSVDIAAGTYMGKESFQGKNFYKIFDTNRKLTVFIPLGDESKLRKLPSKSTVLKNLKMFEHYELIDSQEVEGSRYKYFKTKMEKMTFKGVLEVYHDLSYLVKEKSISTTERKLWLKLKDKLIHEISHILENSEDQVEGMLTLKRSEA